MTARIEGRTDAAPAPAGPYSQCVRIGAIVCAAGQGGIAPDGALRDGVAAQTTQALSNIVAALASCGAAAGDVVQVRVYLTDAAHFEAMNSAYREFFSAPYPARTTIFAGLAPGLLVEIDALAVLPND